MVPRDSSSLFIWEANMLSFFLGCSLCLNTLPALLCWADSSWFSMLGSSFPPPRPLPWLHPGQEGPLSTPCSLLTWVSFYTVLGYNFLSVRLDLVFRVPKRPLQGNTNPEKCSFLAKGEEWILFFLSLASGPLAWHLGTGTIIITGPGATVWHF